MRGAVAAVGVFDGVHRGHQAILRLAARRARALGASPVAVTFHPHPLSVLRPGRSPELLLTLDQRKRFFGQAGVRRTEVVPFTRSFAAWPPERFAERVLAGRLRAREVVVGYDFRFGRGRAGGVETLRQAGRRLGFAVRVVGPVRAGGARVSSREIRRRMARGDLAGVTRALGRPPTVVGRVTRGAGRGAQLGFPTANLQVEAGVLPPVGVYAVRAGVEGGPLRPGMANLGYRPTFGRAPAQPLLEVPLFGFRRPLYGRRLEVELLRRLRPERRFPSAQALARQLARDAARAKRVSALQAPRRVVSSP